MTNVIDLAKKLKALAERGIGGEKMNALAMLEALMVKHNITNEQLSEHAVKLHQFKVEHLEKRLLLQIIGMVNRNLRAFDVKPEYIKQENLDYNVMVECTHAEFIEILGMLDFYKRLMNEEIDIFFNAFLGANNLLLPPSAGEQQDWRKIPPQELENYIRAQQMAEHVKSATYRRQMQQGNTALRGYGEQ